MVLKDLQILDETILELEFKKLEFDRETCGI